LIRRPFPAALNREGYELNTPSSSPYLTGHLIVIAVCMAILCSALLISPAGSGERHLHIGSFLIPDICIFKNLTGIRCPGCGLTRAMVAAAHGEIEQSLSHHRLGLLALVYVLTQFICRVFLVFIPASARIKRQGGYLDRGMAVLGGLFFLNWLFSFLI